MLTAHFYGSFSVCQDPHLNRFFQQCQKRELDLSLPPTSNFLNCLKVRENTQLVFIYCDWDKSQDLDCWTCVINAAICLHVKQHSVLCFLLFYLFPPFSTSSSSYASFPPFSRVSSAWRESQWSSDFCQCSSTSCSRSWLRMTMMRSLLPPLGRLWYYNVYNYWIYNRVGAQWMW